MTTIRAVVAGQHSGAVIIFCNFPSHSEKMSNDDSLSILWCDFKEKCEIIPVPFIKAEVLPDEIAAMFSLALQGKPAVSTSGPG